MPDDFFDDIASAALGGSNLQESFRNDGLLGHHAEEIEIPPAPASRRYTGPDQAVELATRRLSEELAPLDEFTSDQLTRALPLPLRKRESVRVLKSRPAWPVLVRAAATLVEKDRSNAVAGFVLAVEKGYETLAASCAKRAFRRE